MAAYVREEKINSIENSSNWGLFFIDITGRKHPTADHIL
jgi:hypothetical protein